MGLGLSPYDWQSVSSDFVNSKSYAYRNRYSTGFTGNNQSVPRYNTQSAISETTGNTCTDEKDDGKVGLLKGIFYVGKGAVKGIIDGIKGCVTDKNGNFSLGKTLATVAIGAACIAFPAAGLIAAGIGVVAGGAKLINGISEASKATTDAAKKDALENIGDGALTLGVSVLGVKASAGAVVETAGNASKVAQLEKDATMLQKIGAYGSDMIASTKNCWSNLTTRISNFWNSIKETSEYSKKMNNISNKYKSLDPTKMTAEERIRANAQQALEEMQTYDPKLTKQANNMKFGKIVSNAKTKFGNTVSYARTKIDGTQTANYFKTLTEGGIRNIINNIRTNGDSLKITQLVSGMSKDAQAVISFLKNENGISNEALIQKAVEKFGYANVAEALETFASVRMLDETV